jgi:hypothetical protein
MKKTAIRDLHTRRGKPAAELRPRPRKASKIQFPDLSRIWRTFPQLAGDSARFIEEDRDRCSDRDE